MEFTVGDIITGTVTGITKFGAFLALPGDKSGLVHISEVADDYVKDVSDFLSVSDEVRVKVLEIFDNGKISLSIKKALPPKPKYREPVIPFEDMVSRFMKDSNEKLVELKRHQEGRKNSR